LNIQKFFAYVRVDWRMMPTCQLVWSVIF